VVDHTFSVLSGGSRRLCAEPWRRSWPAAPARAVVRRYRATIAHALLRAGSPELCVPRWDTQSGERTREQSAHRTPRKSGGGGDRSHSLRRPVQAVRAPRLPTSVPGHGPPRTGTAPPSAITRNNVQDLVDRLVAAGRALSTVRNTILPLRALYRRALARDQVALNPTPKLSLPAVRGARDRVARPGKRQPCSPPYPPRIGRSRPPPSTPAYAAANSTRSSGPASM